MNTKIFIITYFVFTVVIICRLFFFYSFPLQFKDGQEVRFETTLWSEPQIKWNSLQIKVRLGDFWHSIPVQIKAPRVPEFSYGETLLISGKITHQFLSKKKTFVWTIIFPKIQVKTSGFLPIFMEIRQHIIVFCETTFLQPYSSLVLGILLGIKQGLPVQTTAAFRSTGLSHLLVIDGMKVTLLTGFVMTFLGTLFTRKLAILFSILFIGIYMILSGLEISALRAGVMGIMAFSAQLWGRQYTGLHSLFLVSGLLLLWDPFLLENVGFQLSVLATAGIILLKPLIPLKGMFLDDISITLAAQIATLPILLATFGNYGLLSIPAHVLVLWVIPPIMVISGTGVLVSFLFQPVGSFILQLTLPLLWYLQTIAIYFSRFNWNLQVPAFNLWFTAGYYCIIGAIILSFRKD